MSARSVAPSRLCRTAHGLSAVPTVQCPFVSLVALITRRVLLFCAKHLFVAAIGGSSTAGADLDIRLPRRPAGARRQAPSDFGRGALLPWADLQAKNLPAFPYY